MITKYTATTTMFFLMNDIIATVSGIMIGYDASSVSVTLPVTCIFKTCRLSSHV